MLLKLTLRDDPYLDFSQMPVLSGVEVARELRRIGCDIFVVGATGNVSCNTYLLTTVFGAI